MHTNVTARNTYFSFYTFITLLWLTGMVVGLAVAFYFSYLTGPMMRNTIWDNLSVCGFFVSCVIPLGLTYCFIHLQWMPAMFILLFINALLYGFCFFSTAFCYQQVAWLATGVSFFNQSCCSLLIFFMCLCSKMERFLFRKVSLCLFGSFAVICISKYLITSYIN